MDEIRTMLFILITKVHISTILSMSSQDRPEIFSNEIVSHVEEVKDSIHKYLRSKLPAGVSGIYENGKHVFTEEEKGYNKAIHDVYEKLDKIFHQ